MSDFIGILGLGILNALLFLPWVLIFIGPFAVAAFGITGGFFYMIRVKQNAVVSKEFKVLVADDDEFSILPLVNSLTLADRVSFQIVSSGNEALAALQKDRYDLLFLDMGMPGKSGAETLIEGNKKLTNLEKRVPVVYYTSSEIDYSDLPEKEMARFRVLDVWKKTQSMFMLNQRVNELLSAIAVA